MHYTYICILLIYSIFTQKFTKISLEYIFFKIQNLFKSNLIHEIYIIIFYTTHRDALSTCKYGTDMLNLNENDVDAELYYLTSCTMYLDPLRLDLELLIVGRNRPSHLPFCWGLENSQNSDSGLSGPPQ